MSDRIKGFLAVFVAFIPLGTFLYIIVVFGGWWALLKIVTIAALAVISIYLYGRRLSRKTDEY